MISIKENIKNLGLISIKLNVPQVGSKVKNFKTLNDIEENILFDFIVNENGEIIIGKGHYKLNNKKKRLIFAGRLKIKEGLIFYIDNDSGHYFPNEERLKLFYNILKKTKYSHPNMIFKNIIPEAMRK